MKNPHKLAMYAVLLTAFVLIGLVIKNNLFAPIGLTVVNTDISYSTESVDVIIQGEVKNEGTYSVNIGMTCFDALCMAGGVTPRADINSVDVTRVITAPCTISVSKADTSSAVVQSENDGSIYTQENKLNINTASIKELDSLDKIGEELARRIIEYREENGAYKSIEELLNVKGIGKANFAAIKDNITVGGTK